MVPILWRFGKLNFTYLRSLRHRSRCLLWRQSRRECRNRRLINFDTLIYSSYSYSVPEQARVMFDSGTLVHFGTLVYTNSFFIYFSSSTSAPSTTLAPLDYFYYSRSRRAEVDEVYFGSYTLAGDNFKNEAWGEKRCDYTLPETCRLFLCFT